VIGNDVKLTSTVKDGMFCLADENNGRRWR